MTSTIDLWLSALAADVGVVVQCDPDDLIPRLYRDRAASGDERLNAIQVKRSPERADEIWLVKSGRKIQGAPRK